MKNFFAEEEALRQLSAMGDPLEKLDACIDWEIFRAPVEKFFPHLDISREVPVSLTSELLPH
ncbi:MAG: hypothetical protein LBC38_04245 [Oscillospiraceae bacterium]|jgi:hypothetical protein|nr:hypothetical protein [Oscillospiraceae bacterium]